MPPATSANAAAVEGKAAAAPVQDAALASCGPAAELPEQQPEGARAAGDPASPEQGIGALPLGHSEALGQAAQWVVLLVVATARERLPPQGLTLLADLAQLLFCAAGPTAPPGHNLVQVRLDPVLWRRASIAAGSRTDGGMCAAQAASQIIALLVAVLVVCSGVFCLMPVQDALDGAPELV